MKGLATLIAGLMLATATGLTSESRAQAGLPFSLPVPVEGVEKYDETIPTPASIIGHEIGTRHTEPHQVAAYFQAVAEASPRVSLETHGSSYEGRSLIHAIVTSPEHHDRLEAVRRENLRLSEAPGSVSDEELSDMPAIVYAGYSIHGNEASGTEAAVLLLYHLAAGSGPGVDDVLRQAVVLIDPMFNPDGRGRFTTWVNRYRGHVPVADPFDREHLESWPGGRTNHYWFDLNRDWLPAQHPETRGRLEVFYAWRPHVLTDHHEMDSDATFFFQPGIPGRNNPNAPERVVELTARLGGYHARALDRIGSLYYTRESFDDFYPGKGSTYPDVNGTVGILFEQASSRALEREVDGITLSYAFTIRNHLVTSLSTLEGVLAMREDLLRHQRDFYAGASAFAASVVTTAYVLDAVTMPSRTKALVDVLSRHLVQVHELGRRLELDGTTYEAGEAFVVPLDQPQARFVKSAMERTSSYRDSLFYDVSTWTLPLAFGVPYAEMQTDPSPYFGDLLEAIVATEDVVGGPADYVYLLEWGRYFSPRALYALLDRGVRLRAMTEPFTLPVDGGDQTFDRGSIVIPAEQSALSHEQLHELLEDVAREDNVRVYAIDSGLTPVGPDLGARSSSVLERPSIALLTGDGTTAYHAGEVWHLLSERFDIPVSLLDLRQVDRADLERYSTIVMAGGSYEGLAADLIAEWIHGGGHLIGMTDGADWVVENALFDLTAKSTDLDTLFRPLPFEALDRARGAQGIGGAIFRIHLDVTHPIGYGYPDVVPVFRRGTTFYEVPLEPGLGVARYADEPRMSGYVSEEMVTESAGSAAIVARSHGSGKVTLFMDNPNFRAFWYGTNGLFLNAILFGSLY